MQRILRNASGFSLVESLIALGVLAVIGLGSTQLLVRSGKTGILVKSNTAIQITRARLIDAIQSEIAWKLTVANSPSLSCLQSHSDCSSISGNPVPVALYELPPSAGAAPQRLTDPSNPSQGFTLSGETCNTFRPSGSPECPIQYSTSVTLLCLPGAPCTNPQIRVTGALSTAAFQGFAQNAAINVARNSFQMYRGPASLSSNDACVAAGGTLDTTSTPGVTTCRAPFADQSCPAGQVVIGADYTTGQIRCGTAIPAFSCPPNTVPKGFRADGTMECVTKSCSGTSCPGGCCTPPCAPFPVDPNAVPGSTGGSDGGAGADGGCGGSDGSC